MNHSESASWFENLPKLVALLFLGSTCFLVVVVALLVIRLAALLHGHVHVHIAQYGIFIMTLLPWGHALVGLRALNKLAAAKTANREIMATSLALAVMPFWCYLLVIFASDLFSVTR